MLKKLMLLIYIIPLVLSSQNKLTFCNEIINNVNQPPKLSFETPDYDFGEVFRGEEIEHVYKFKNIGKGELNIKEIKTSCGCTAAVISSESIHSNEFGEIKVTYNSKSDKGNVSKHINVYSNDPDSPKYKLTISGNVVEEVVVKPRKLNLSEVLYGTGTRRNITVKSIKDHKFEVSKIESSSPDVEVLLKKNDKMNEYVVRTTLKKEAKLGRFNSKIVLHTNSSNMEKVTIPVFGRVVGDISVYPPRISCGIVPQKEEKKVSAFATAYNKDVEIDKIEAFPEFLSADISRIEDNMKTYKISVTLKKDAPVGRFTGGLKIYTSSKNQPVIDVPVYGMVKES